MPVGNSPWSRKASLPASLSQDGGASIRQPIPESAWVRTPLDARTGKCPNSKSQQLQCLLLCWLLFSFFWWGVGAQLELLFKVKLQPNHLFLDKLRNVEPPVFIVLSHLRRFPLISCCSQEKPWACIHTYVDTDIASVRHRIAVVDHMGCLCNANSAIQLYGWTHIGFAQKRCRKRASYVPSYEALYLCLVRHAFLILANCPHINRAHIPDSYCFLQWTFEENVLPSLLKEPRNKKMFNT